MLDNEYDKERELLKLEYKDKWVTISVDGWTSPLGCPWIGIAVNADLLTVVDASGEVKAQPASVHSTA